VEAQQRPAVGDVEAVAVDQEGGRRVRHLCAAAAATGIGLWTVGI